VTQPHDLDAERAVLGALLSGAPPDSVSALAPADFYRPAHQLIFEAIGALAGGGKPADPIAVADELRRRGQLTRMGGAPYLHTCMQATPAAANAGYYARIIREHAYRRVLVEHASRIMQAANDPGAELADIRTLSERSPNLNGLLTSLYDGSDASDRDEVLLAGIRDGAWLSVQQFAPLRFAVPGLIPEGLCFLIGAPKIGKSWLLLNLLLGVASGGVALGRIRAGDARPVLYLALEDSDRRMQDRCHALLGDGQQIPALFSYKTRVEPGAVLETIGAWMRRYPSSGLVVIDTLGKVLPPAAQGESAYGRDYRVGSALKAQADAHPGLAVVVSHHDRKASADDFIDSVSGTHGLAGAADTIAVLARRRQSGEATLKITGRDVPEDEYALTLTDGKAWQLDGSSLAASAATARSREAAKSLSGLAADVLRFVTEHPEGVRAREVAERFGEHAPRYLTRLYDAGRVDKVERGLYVTSAQYASEASEASEPQVSDPAGSDTRSDTVRIGGGWPEGSIGEEANQ
jgi:hypothetical protein